MRMIDADALEETFRKTYKVNGKGVICTVIDEAPTVEAEPVRHAHWVWKGDEGDARFMCSACGGKEHVPTCMGVPNIWEYCPNCGARMEEYELARKRADTETD